MNRIRLRCDDLGQGRKDGSFEIQVVTPKFTGAATFFGDVNDIEAFADRLSGYPLDPSNRPEFRADHVALRIEPSGGAGHLMLHLSLREYYVGHDRLSVAIPATYAGLQEMQRRLREFIQSPFEQVEIDIH